MAAWGISGIDWLTCAVGVGERAVPREGHDRASDEVRGRGLVSPICALSEVC